MKNIKLYFYGIIAIFFIGAVVMANVYKNKYEREQINSLRLSQNNLQLMSSERTNTNLLMTKDELISTMSTELDSALKRLSIPLKTITKIVEKEVIIHDTTIKTVFVQSSGKDEWVINDSDKCWNWSGVANLIADSLNVKRTEFNYHNNHTDIFNWIRPHKFLFFKWGKKEVIQTSSSECGETTSRTISIIKK